MIICGNCAEILAGFPDDYIDLTVTSPPYDNLRDYNGYIFEFEKVAQQLFRVTKKGGVVVWVVADATINGSETGTSFRQALCFMEFGFNLHQTLFYDKTNGPPPDNTRYEKVLEFMFVLSKGTPNIVNLIYDKPNKWAGATNWGTRTIREKNGKLSKRKNVQVANFGKRLNVWKYATGKGFSSKDEFASNHPAIFPEALARDHIISWSNPGDIVLDPMCGSGTTLKMAKETNRRFIGIDISPEYCQLSKRRVKGARVPLFTLEPEPIENKEEQLGLL